MRETKASAVNSHDPSLKESAEGEWEEFFAGTMTTYQVGLGEVLHAKAFSKASFSSWATS